MLLSLSRGSSGIPAAPAAGAAAPPAAAGAFVNVYPGGNGTSSFQYKGIFVPSGAVTITKLIELLPPESKRLMI